MFIISSDTSFLVLQFYMKIIHAIPGSEKFINLVHLRGPFAQKKNYYYLGCDESLYTYVKLKIKWGNRHELFFHFPHRKRVIHRKRRKGFLNNEPNGRTVQPTQLIFI